MSSRAEAGRGRAGRGRAALVAVALGSLTACAEPDANADTDEAGSETGDAPPPGPPVLVEPVESATLIADQRADLVLTAADLLPGTRVEIDGASWALTGEGPLIRAGQTLRLPLAGALVVGEHELVLTHEVGKELLRSDPLTIVVAPAPLDPASASLDPSPVAAGELVSLRDAGEPGTLALVGPSAVELRSGDWAQPGATLELPGLEPLGIGAPGLATAGLDLGRVELDGGPGLLAAWIAGDELRARVARLDADGALAELGPVASVWSLADPDDRALLGPHELASLHGVALLDRMLVGAVEARRDAEALTPGDRLLVTRWLGPSPDLDLGAAAGPAQALRGPGSRDLDLPRRAQRWLDLGSSAPALSLRLAQAYPWLLVLAGNGLPVLAEDPGELASAPGPTVVWMASADAALGARTVFAIEVRDDEAQLRVLRIDRWGTPGPDAGPIVDVIELPAIPVAAPSMSLLAGAAIVAIPFGAAAPSWTARSAGDRTILDSLVELGCDAIHLDRPDPSGAGDRVDLACLRDGVVHLGELGVVVGR